ncbi:MAG: polymer-forming cytoskeletal protein [Desulfurivibrionaceae bacterium]|nr:polymer-forming cytoskeletal protein [Desulfobulbales bacterium]MDT8335753.1 polymer-forming cytoskeletal protein [Desulfurivibrionaceae bacterium]
MSIFNDRKADSPPSQSSPISSIIGQDMILTGDLEFNSKIQVDGTINGNLKGNTLVLSSAGRINGDIEAESVTCYGKVDGNIKAGSLFLKKSGVINGRVETTDLSVESGGVLNGEIKSSQQTPDLKAVKNAPAAAPSKVPEFQEA